MYPKEAHVMNHVTGTATLAGNKASDSLPPPGAADIDIARAARSLRASSCPCSSPC